MLSSIVHLDVTGIDVVLCTWNSCYSCWFLILSSVVVDRIVTATRKVVLTNVPVKDGVICSYVYGVFNGSMEIVPFPTYCSEVSTDVPWPVCDILVQV